MPRNPDPRNGNSQSPRPAIRPGKEQLARSPEANATRSHAKGVPQPVPEDEKARREKIEQAAYRRAEQRGFAPGQEMDDWLQAEQDYEREKGGRTKTEKH